MISLGYIKCPHCQSMISKLANKCPRCHEILNKEEINNIVKNEQQKDKALNLGCLGFTVSYFIIALFLKQFFDTSFLFTAFVSMFLSLIIAIIISKKNGF